MRRHDPLTALGYDVFLNTLLQIQQSTSFALLTVNLVNKDWHSIAQPLIDRQLDITIGEQPVRNKLLFARLQDEDFKARVQEIIVRPTETQEYLPNDENELAVLATFLPWMRITRFHWRFRQIPPDFLIEVLRNCDGCAIQISPSQVYLGPHNHAAWYWEKGFGRYAAGDLLRLQLICSKIETLRLEGSYDLEGFNNLGRLLALSVQLSSLELKVTIPGVLRSERSKWPTWYAGWLSESLLGHVLNLRTIRLDGLCACDDNEVRRWGQILHWETLENASFTCPAFLTCAPSRLIRLHTVRLNIDRPQSGNGWDSVEYHIGLRQNHCSSAPSGDRVRDVLLSLPPLRELCLKNAGVDDSILRRQPKLVHLDLINDLVPGEVTESPFDMSIFRSMHKHCKRLRSLSLRLHLDQLFPCLTYIARHGLSVSHLILDLGIPRNNPNYFEERPHREDLSTCLTIFQCVSSFTVRTYSNCLLSNLNIGLSVCLPMDMSYSTEQALWVLAEREYRLDVKYQDGKSHAVFVPVPIESSISQMQEASGSVYKRTFQQLDFSKTQITELGGISFDALSYNRVQSAGNHQQTRILDLNINE
ncbi:hypothetical protein BT63DRAFT_428923 [Microthyrium microscopicum]|uniref:Uncharacterized protein n=1 Tax=Microthyrium microscopicum TaxID=703497 RepID=A0A6A6TYR7_9PEZI|nr:hypothetical protein BT63DRAFT_428923 [Microthyrium microscopicum]